MRFWSAESAEKKLPTPIFVIFAIFFLIVVIGINILTGSLFNKILTGVDKVQETQYQPDR